MVRVEHFLIPGFEPEPNPETDAKIRRSVSIRLGWSATSPMKTRLRLLAQSSWPCRAFLGGGPSFDGIARTIVRGCTEDGFPVEFWTIDRRSNGLEDLTGMNAAERDRRPEIAWGYYFGDAEVDGKTFAGYVPQGDVSYMSEWGMETHIEDLARRHRFDPPRPSKRGTSSWPGIPSERRLQNSTARGASTTSVALTKSRE